MSTGNDWLAMLEKATNYGDLQSVFARMSDASQSTDDSDAMVASIEEAIRRIELERARDQAELDEFSAGYEAFKQSQAGMIGWFKRKLPFTETRKQELSHRDSINDQAAEILADNFVIARAQMLKERIASPKLRRMGYEPGYWRNQFLSNEAVNSIGEYGTVVSDLGKELSTAKLFIEAIKLDIDAFSSAKFVSQEDQLRRIEDLKAAQRELKALVDESQEKVNLRESALATLKELLINELTGKDVDFRNANQRLGLLESLQEKQPQLAKLLEERVTNAKALVAKLLERDSLPEQREKLEHAINSLKRDWDDAERKRLRAVSELEEPSQLYHAALAEAQQAKAALNATKPLYEAYIAEQHKTSQTAAEVTSESDFELAPSSVLTEYKRLEHAANTATQTLSQRTPTFEQAKRNHDAAVSEAKAIYDKLEAKTLELKKIAQLESEIQQQLLKAKQGIESTFAEFRVAAACYLELARKIAWPDSSGASARAIQLLLDEHTGSGISTSPSLSERLTTPFSGSSFSKPSSAVESSTATTNLTEIQRYAERLERAVQAIDADCKTCLREIATLAKLRKEALQRRGQMLLDQSVLSELIFD